MTAPQHECTNNTQQPSEVFPVLDQNQLTAQQQADLNDPEKQARYLSEFNEQMRRQFCPGCGEG